SLAVGIQGGSRDGGVDDRPRVGRGADRQWGARSDELVPSWTEGNQYRVRWWGLLGEILADRRSSRRDGNRDRRDGHRLDPAAAEAHLDPAVPGLPVGGRVARHRRGLPLARRP